MSKKTRTKGNAPEPAQAPFHGHKSTRRDVAVATAIAAGVAALVLVLAILPAEYGVDPTGFGRWTGIARLSDSANATSDNATAATHTAFEAMHRNDTAAITLRPGEGMEYKLRLSEGEALVYGWSAPAPLYFDFHGEPNDARTFPDGKSYQSYREDTLAAANGAFTAPFDGRHGWYWQNNGPETVTVTLRTAGYYEVIGLV